MRRAKFNEITRGENDGLVHNMYDKGGKKRGTYIMLSTD